MSLKGIYLDDYQPEQYAELLGSDEIAFDAPQKILDLPTMATEILAGTPDVLVMDYRLNENKDNHNNLNDYRAGSLAQYLREKALESPAKDFPIVLVSTEEKIKKLFNPDKTAHDLFDEYYTKEDINKDEDRVEITKQIISLALGYKKIIQAANNTNSGYEKLLEASGQDSLVLEDTNLGLDINSEKIPHVIARIILTNVIKRTGLLLRRMDLFARLGVDVLSSPSDKEKILSYFFNSGCEYRGIFSEGWPRIWKHRFDAWSKTHFGEPLTNIPANKRVEKLNSLRGWSCVPAKSPWTGKDNELLSFSCASCSRPAELRNSVSVHEVSSPKYVEKRRVCFDCIETEKYLERLAPLQISVEESDIVEQIKTGALKRE